MTTTDPTTGFPKVPEGYFWEVRQAATAGAFRLQLRKKSFWIFSTVEEWTIVWPPLSPSSLYTEALFVLGKYKEYQHRVEAEFESSRYIGKYPPKNLKDAPK